MNSQTWLITYLTQNGLEISLLKHFKYCEFCLFRQQSAFLLVGRCPLLAVRSPVLRMVGSALQSLPAPCSELGLREDQDQAHAKAPGWCQRRIPGPRNRGAEGPRVQAHSTAAVWIQLCFTQKPHSATGHPSKPSPFAWLPVCSTASF